MLITENILYLSKLEAKAILLHASVDCTRPHLSGVLVESGSSTRLVATDGHRLAVAECQGQLTHGGLIRREDLERAIKAAGAKEVLAIEPNGGSHMTLGVATGEGGALRAGVKVSLADERFPPWRQALPGADKIGPTGAGSLGINADYIGDVGAVAKACGKRNGAIKLCIQAGELEPVRWECSGNGADWEGCIMPVRI